MGKPVKRGGGGTEFAWLRNTVQWVYDVATGGFQEMPWDFTTRDEGSDVDLQNNGVKAVDGGDYWVSVGIRVRRSNGGSDNTQWSLRAKAAGLVKATSDALEGGVGDDWRMFGAGLLLKSVDRGELITAEIDMSSGLNGDLDVAGTATQLYMTVARVGAGT